MSQCMMDCERDVYARGYCRNHYQALPEFRLAKRARDRSYNAKRDKPKDRYPPDDDYRFHRLKQAAKKRRLSFDLRKDDYLKIVKGSVCSYCQGALSVWGGNLDRLDNEKGYSVENVVACCGYCNALKSALLTAEEMSEVVKLLERMRSGSIWATVPKGFIFKGKKSLTGRP